MLKRRISCFIICLSALLTLTAMASPLAAQTYPSSMIRIVVPSPPGTPPDIMGRIVANQLSASEGWRVIVENKPGAIQTIGLTDVLKQPADGYTLASIALPASAAPALLPSVSFRLDTDFAPVIKLASAYHILVVTPSVSAKTLQEFVALLKSQPDKMTFSSGGFGTPAHLAGEMFKLQTGVKSTHVPYQGLAKAIPDLMNGTNHYQFITPLPVLQHRGRQTACSRGDWSDAAACAEGRADRRGSRISGPHYSGLVRNPGEDRYAERDCWAAKPSNKQVVGAAQRAGGNREVGRRTRRRDTCGIRDVPEIANRPLGQNREAVRDQAATMMACDIKVTLLGTEVLIPSRSRFGPSTLVEAGDRIFLIDAGRGNGDGQAPDVLSVPHRFNASRRTFAA